MGDIGGTGGRYWRAVRPAVRPAVWPADELGDNAGMSTVRSLADELRARDDEQLVALLLSRPDLAVPAPSDLAALAARAAGRSSVYRALAGLDRARLHVAALIAGAGGLGDDEVARRCAAPADVVTGIIDDLVQLALIWGPAQARRPVRVLNEVLAASADADSSAGCRLPTPPDPPGAVRDPAGVDYAAAGAVTEIVMLVEDVVRLLDDDPPSVLRQGGLSARELARVTRQLGLGETDAALALELAGAAGLINTDRRRDVVRPTETGDEWRALPLIDRWIVLVDGWLLRAGSTSLVGTRDERGQLRAVLGPGARRDGEIRLRRVVLTVLARAEPGVVHDVGWVEAMLVHQAPRGPVASAAHTLPAIWSEGHALGVLAENCLSTFGRVAVGVPDSGRPGAGDADSRAGTVEAARLASLLPTEVDRVLAQADLTAVAPGPLSPASADLMHLLADVESRGAARVFRFSASSVERALQAGLDAAQLLTRLREICGEVPQPLVYLVGDVARRHGQLRLGAASSYVRDEPERLAELLADPALGALRLSRLAPTVLVSPLSPAALLTGLRSAGLAPVVEGPDGEALPGTLPARAPDAVPDPPARGGDPQAALALVRALRRVETAGTRPTPAEAPQVEAQDPAVSIGGLRAAAASGRYVWVATSDPVGQPQCRLVQPLSVDRGQARVLDAASGRVVVVSAHRITGVLDRDSDQLGG